MSNLYGYNTSSAYKLEIDFDVKRRSESTRLHRNDSRTETKAKAAGKRQSIKLANILRVALCFVVAFVIVNGYVKINEAYNEIAQLEEKYNKVVATNQDLQVKIDKAVDLEQLQSIANEKYGMVRPERYQMFYVDMEQGDVAETYADREDTKKNVAMSGVAGTITSAMNIFK